MRSFFPVVQAETKRPSLAAAATTTTTTTTQLYTTPEQPNLLFPTFFSLPFLPSQIPVRPRARGKRETGNESDPPIFPQPYHSRGNQTVKTSYVSGHLELLDVAVCLGRFGAVWFGANPRSYLQSIFPSDTCRDEDA